MVNICIFPAIFKLRNRIKIISPRFLLFWKPIVLVLRHEIFHQSWRSWWLQSFSAFTNPDMTVNDGWPTVILRTEYTLREAIEFLKIPLFFWRTKYVNQAKLLLLLHNSVPLHKFLSDFKITSKFFLKDAKRFLINDNFPEVWKMFGREY